MMLELDRQDEDLLGGRFGPAAAEAMRLLLRYGEILGAERFVSIVSAHIDTCLYHGPSSLDFVRRYVALGGRVRVPTTLNVAAIDLLHPEWYPDKGPLADAQADLVQHYQALGCIPTLTCAPYQRIHRPLRGEHVAWAESNAITFVNSVLGARTDRYGDFTDLCAALTGRVPLVGLHRDENRKARLIVEAPGVDATGLPRDLYFACLGYALGRLAGNRVPALLNVEPDASEDELKGLGTAAASSGSVALFHAVGVTPEAPNLDSVTAGDPKALERVAIGSDDLRAIVQRLCPFTTGHRVAAICLGTPHFSRSEFQKLALLVDGLERHEDVEVYVSTSREIAAEVEADEALQAIRSFGIQIVVDTCTYVTPMIRQMEGAILTNSAKWVHYAPGNIGRTAGLMSIERCIRSAVTGRVEAS